MDVMVFRSFRAQIERLSVGEIRSLREMLGALEARIAVRARIDTRGEAIEHCPHCRGERLQRWGETRTGLRRLRCKDCRRTFSSATGTALARLRLPEKFHQAVEDMLSRAPSSCRALAARLGVHRMTVWRWRMRVLAALTGGGAPALGGVVEADEKLFRDWHVGSREWVNHLRAPDVFLEPDRPRWEDHRRLKGRLPGGIWKYQVPVLTLADRAGARRAEVMPDRRGASVVAALERHIGRDTVLCSDGDGAYDVFARRHALPHYRLNAKTGPRVIDTAFHIQTVNALHSRFESFMRPFCGPATKNLPRYAVWFIAREQTRPTDAAWQRLLAA
jgi:transposase-like protein